MYAARTCTLNSAFKICLNSRLTSVPTRCAAPFAYLRSGWRVFDLTLILAGWLPHVLPNDAGNISALRVGRCLRPLRTVTRLPGLQRAVRTLLAALPGKQPGPNNWTHRGTALRRPNHTSHTFTAPHPPWTALADVVMLVGICVALFAILGLQLFQGLLRRRCFVHGADTPVDAETGVCAKQGRFGRSCAPGLECKEWGANPLAGTVSFDNFMEALMTSFQCVTLEGWSEVMYLLQAAAGNTSGTDQEI